ncbi:Demethylrebeccamycin-D-glucose O-methyltransferase [Nymphaea thermarum]|nr:Demethylrebeccamycin-D-glucose O-methyltransferase [Nymphaea thermarum]
MASDRSSSQLLQSPPAKLGPVSLVANWVRPFWRASSRRAPESAKPEAAKAKSLQQGIAEFYDESSGAWEDIWGEHMHHGFYQPGEKASLSGHRSAQLRMIEEALCFAGVPGDEEGRPKRIVDVGCGIGGSSRYLAGKYGARCRGITLSPFQARRANKLSSSQGLGDQVFFQVADALDQPFPDGKFDLVWSMESGEHMPDKKKFVSELARVAAPGAMIIIVTWCHRNLLPNEDSLQPQEKELQDIKTADWSEHVAPFWPAVIRSALSLKGFISMLRAGNLLNLQIFPWKSILKASSFLFVFLEFQVIHFPTVFDSTGWKTMKGAMVMPLMIEGYKANLIKFAIITCKKPLFQ